MIRHAKAPSAGSTSGQGDSRGSFGRGAVAIRGISGDADGSGARSAPARSGPRSRSRLLLALCLAAVAALAALASPALASQNHPYTGISIGPDGTAGVAKFVSPAGVAVEQATGNVYVYDGGEGKKDPVTQQPIDPDEGKLYKFDSSGQPVDFSSLGTNVVEGLPTGEGGVQVAVAPAGAAGGTAGDIYFTVGGFSVQVYAASGAKLGELEGGGPIGARACGVATDPAGNVFVGFQRSNTQPKGEPKTIVKYTPKANPVVNVDKSGALTINMPGTCSVAVGSDGSIYGYTGGGLYGLAKYESLSDLTPTILDRNASDVALNPATSDVYANRGNEIRQYSPSGVLIGKSGQEHLLESFSSAVNAAAGKLFATNGGSDKVDIFGPLVIVPDSNAEAATARTKTSALLHGTVDAAGGPSATCEFEYATREEVQKEGFKNADKAPCSPAGPFTGSGVTAVSAAVSGLSSNTTYSFRLAATNANGSNFSDPVEFTTVDKVSVETNAATNLTTTAARLNGTINPEGVEIEDCSFEYELKDFNDLTENYASTVPCVETPASIGVGNAPVSVHADLSGLTIGTRYRFRLTAENNLGAGQGSEVQFVTKGPSILDQSIAALNETEAILAATLNPNNSETSYRFEYVSEADFAVNGYADAKVVPVGGQTIGSGNGNVDVTQEIGGLTPLTTYHMRVVATNSDGVHVGDDLLFTTYQIATTGLPDGRVYEQATPVDKNGSDVQGGPNEVRTSPQGNGITYFSNSGIPGGEGAQNLPSYLALRGPTGWTNQGLLAPASAGSRSRVVGLSQDLSRSFATAGTPVVDKGFYEKDTATGQQTTIMKLPSTTFNNRAGYLGSSADNSEVIFESTERLIPGFPNFIPKVYFWDKDAGKMSMAGVTNAGEVPEYGAIGGAYDWYASGNTEVGGRESQYYTQAQNVISRDGTKVFFTSGAEAGLTGPGYSQIYVRKNPTQPQSAMSGEECTEPAKACTIEISKSVRTTPDPGGTKPAAFVTATPDGSQAFFLSKSELTDNANTGTADNHYNLYRYDTITDTLTNLVPAGAPENPEGAEIVGVVGTSDDGSYVYFAANGLLAPGATTRGKCKAGLQEGAIQHCNLYLWHDGSIEFIAEVGAANSGGGSEHSRNELSTTRNWAPNQGTLGEVRPRTGRVTPDGKTMLFSSVTNLTDYDSRGKVEQYRYRVGSGGFTCVTCRPSNLPPQSDAKLASIVTSFLSPDSMDAYYTRNLSSDGNRVFFETADKMVSADNNNVLDVYQWEANGTGSCQSSAENGGCVSLISTGTSPLPSSFADASASGDDAFFYTAQPLVGQDRDELVDIYDARVGGGLASQNPSPPSICVGEACRPPATPGPTTQSSGTSVFSGPPNPKSKPKPKKCRRGFEKRKVKGKVRCVKKQHKKSSKSQRGNNR